MSRSDRLPPLCRVLLRLMLPAYLRDDVLSDMAERHRRLSAAHGKRAADRWYRDQTRRSIRPALWGSDRGSLPEEVRSMLSTLVQDLRHALRWSRANPGFTSVVVLTLALGIGANTAMFSIVSGVLLRPLPYPDSERIGRFYNTDPDDRTITNPVSWVEAVEYRDAARSLPGVEALVPFDAYEVTLTGVDLPRRVLATFASAEFFTIFGTEPLLGRTFLPDENRPGADDAVVLSHGLWREAFGGRQDVLDLELEVDGRARRIVGVMPPDFDYYPNARVWLPLALDEAALVADQIRSHGTPALIKIAPGFTPAEVERELDPILARVLARYPAHGHGHAALIVPLRTWFTGSIRPTLLALMAAVGCLLLIGCANVANLLLARAESRRREFAVRRALGAGTLRLSRQLLAESTLLALAAGLLALLLSWWSRGAIVASLSGAVPRTEGIVIDARVLAFTLVVSLVTGWLFGLAPLVPWRRERAASSLRDGSGSGSGGGLRFRQALIVAEVGLVVILLTGAGLVGRSFLSLATVDPGVDTDRALVFDIALPETGYPTQGDTRDFFVRLVERLEGTAGIEAAGAVSWLPYIHEWSNWGLDVEGREPTGDERGAHYALVVGDYFDAIGIPLLRGRGLRDEDVDNGMLITRTTEQVYFGDGEALGHRVRLSDYGNWRSVVGVVDDYRNQGFQQAPDPGIYIPHTVLNFGSDWFPRRMGVVVRAAGEPTDLMPLIRDVVGSMDAELPVDGLRPLGDAVDGVMLARPRLMAGIFIGFATLALLLGAVGIHGVVAWSVQRETREIGVRLALGARGGSVLRHVAVRALTPVALGLLVGFGVGALLLPRVIGSLLVRVGPQDPVTLVIVVAVLGGSALLATFGPALRALRIDPVEALRVG